MERFVPLCLVRFFQTCCVVLVLRYFFVVSLHIVGYFYSEVSSRTYRLFITCPCIAAAAARGIHTLHPNRGAAIYRWAACGGQGRLCGCDIIYCRMSKRGNGRAERREPRRLISFVLFIVEFSRCIVDVVAIVLSLYFSCSHALMVFLAKLLLVLIYTV